jgi:hypothetical protein
VAVLVAGRGQGLRTEMLGWARLLARHGVAALVWDGRGEGSSTGDAATVTADDLFADVRAAVAWAAARADLGPVGLVSYSAGGWIVPTVAAERDDIRFVVTLAGPATSLADQQAYTTTAFMRASGTAYTDDEYADAFAYQRQTVLLAQSDAPWDAFDAINGPARTARWATHALIPATAADPDLDYFRRSRSFGAPPWGRVRAPVLAIYGEADPIVSPVDHVPVLSAALAPGTDATVVVAPGADHTLARPAAVVGEGVWPARYYRPWTRSAVVFDALVGWFAARFP